MNGVESENVIVCYACDLWTTAIPNSNLHFEKKYVKYVNWFIDRSLCDKSTKLVQMIVTIYRVQAYQVPIVNPRWPPTTSDRRDFPRIIEIDLFYLCCRHMVHIKSFHHHFMNSSIGM